MNKYKAYTQKDWNAEKFYIEENGEPAVIEADTEEEALELFTDYIYATTLYTKEETTKWIEENPITVEELKSFDEFRAAYEAALSNAQTVTTVIMENDWTSERRIGYMKEVYEEDGELRNFFYDAKSNTTTFYFVK